MIAKVNVLLEELESATDLGPVESFAEFLRDRRFGDDADLADLIEVDARSRLAAGRAVDLDRYLEAVPGLERLPISLDAAIEFTLRSRSGSNQPDPETVQQLERRYPRLARPIRDAAALSAGLATTRAFSDGRLYFERERSLPGDFGPVLRDGRQRYTLLSRIGDGSQGVVYRAIDHALSDEDHQAIVAVKILGRRRDTDRDRWRRADEASRARRIDHPNVVRVLDRGTAADGDDYLTYEFVAGGDLDTLVRQHGVIAPRIAARMMTGIARGVQAAHAAGLLHGDLKPGNILIAAAPGEGASMLPKVADFGVAASLDAGGDSPADEEPRGNLAFVSPEHYRRETGARAATSDVYALGGILYFMLTGRLPNGSTLREVERNHAAVGGRTAAPTLSDAPTPVDRDLEAICRRALAPRVADRYASADALALDLDRWLAHEPITWNRPGPIRRFQLLTRRRPRAVAAGFLAFAMLLGMLSAGFYLLAANRAASQFARREKAYRASVSDTLQRLQSSIGKASPHDVPGDWFPMLSILESVTGPYVFDPRDTTPDPWSRRMKVAADAVRSAQVAGHGNSIEALLWSDTLAFWMLRIGDHERAAKLLSGYDQAWERTLGPDDPWRVVRRALHASADVQKLAAADQPSNQSSTLARAAESALLAADAYCDAHRQGDVLHRFVLGNLATLYSKVLNDPDAAARTARRGEQIRARSMPAPSVQTGIEPQ